MKQREPSIPGYSLVIDGEYKNTLDIEGFSRMMKDPSYCYKFYWLEALVKLISEGVEQTTFDAVIDEMICNAWYSVLEYHIHLSGLKSNGQVDDGLERAVLLLSELSHLPAGASNDQKKNAIHEHADVMKTVKEQLTHNVPYRALAGFFAKDDQAVPWESTRRLTAYIERVNSELVLLPYTLGPSPKLKKEIYFHPVWMEMIQNNTFSILGWIRFEKVRWLQNNNPEVPGLVYKMTPLDDDEGKIERKLGHVRKLWEGILDIHEVRDVFTGRPVLPKQYDVDHFIPWSFVMNDELWNLMPMDSSLNSSKSNLLPRWDRFFLPFAENQFLLYELVHNHEKIHKLFEKCYKDNLHSIWAGQELYRFGNTKETFLNILEKNMQPVYDSAKRQGYEVWGRG